MLIREQLLNYLNQILTPALFPSDPGLNGLQIEGENTIKSIAFAVSVSEEVILKAITLGADTLIVHHGLLWKELGTRPLTGLVTKRFYPLIRHNMNLIAYHLPLDAHMVVGNAVTIADQLALKQLTPFGDYRGSPLGVKGTFDQGITVDNLKQKLQLILNHEILLSSPDGKTNSESKNMITTLGIITGGASGEWRVAKREGLDAYLTGEMREYDWSEAREAGLHFFAGGHHATEQFGIQALMKSLQKEFHHLNLICNFIASNNPA